jgi:hypothetical protein
MAIAAYDLARPLDADGLFHLSLLQRAGPGHVLHPRAKRVHLSLELSPLLSNLFQPPLALLNLSSKFFRLLCAERRRAGYEAEK